ncbi:hypothetical protein Gotur_020634 [Gossypium turneri]
MIRMARCFNGLIFSFILLLIIQIFTMRSNSSKTT